eukprot:Platyproteum_vivax@DN4947_c0_g1_i1.p1
MEIEFFKHQEPKIDLKVDGRIDSSQCLNLPKTADLYNVQKVRSAEDLEVAAMRKKEAEKRCTPAIPPGFSPMTPTPNQFPPIDGSMYSPLKAFGLGSRSTNWEPSLQSRLPVPPLSLSEKFCALLCDLLNAEIAKRQTTNEVTQKGISTSDVERMWASYCVLDKWENFSSLWAELPKGFEEYVQAMPEIWTTTTLEGLFVRCNPSHSVRKGEDRQAKKMEVDNAKKLEIDSKKLEEESVNRESRFYDTEDADATTVGGDSPDKVGPVEKDKKEIIR